MIDLTAKLLNGEASDLEYMRWKKWLDTRWSEKEKDKERNKSSKDRTWSAVPIALLGGSDNQRSIWILFNESSFHFLFIAKATAAFTANGDCPNDRLTHIICNPTSLLSLPPLLPSPIILSTPYTSSAATSSTSTYPLPSFTFSYPSSAAASAAATYPLRFFPSPYTSSATASVATTDPPIIFLPLFRHSLCYHYLPS